MINRIDRQCLVSQIFVGDVDEVIQVKDDLLMTYNGVIY